MWQTIFLFIAVFLLMYGISSFVAKSIKYITLGRPDNLLPQAILMTIGLTYIIWYCN